MLLLPYRRLSPTTFQILVIGVSSALWSEDLDDPNAALEPNGIVLAGPVQKVGDLYLAPIDAEQTALEDYYAWEEVTDEETFCLRTLHVLDAVPPPADALLAPLPISHVTAALQSTGTT
jgi:hypothetical protein